jgi:hypothetical protein
MIITGKFLYHCVAHVGVERNGGADAAETSHEHEHFGPRRDQGR